MSAKPRYRIAGLPEVCAEIEEKTASPKTFHKVDLDEEVKDGAIPWIKAIQALGQPHLSHYLYNFDFKSLGQLWPTFGFINSPASRPVKSAPLALADFLDAGDAGLDLKAILHEFQYQNREATNLNKIVTAVLAHETPALVPLTPLAAAFAAAFFRGSRWLRQNRESILSTILHHPVAAHIALKSGAWPAENDRLVLALSSDPLLLLRYWKSGADGNSIDQTLIAEALETAPHLHCLAANLTIATSQDETFSKLMDAALDHAMAAAFALGLQPRHALASMWTRQIKSNPRAMYWAVRVGAWRQDPTLLPYWNSFRELVRVDPKWGYHWYRDFEPGVAYDFARHHWPDVWAVELVVDLQLSKNWVEKEYHQLRIELPTKDPLLQAMVLWTANYCIGNDDTD